MKKRQKKTVYHWQPEWAFSMVYWCLTFGIFFLGVIGLFEETRMNLFSFIVFLFFLFFVWLGRLRRIYCENNALYFRTILPMNRRYIKIKEIETITFAKAEVVLIYHDEHEEQKELRILMSKKIQKKFFAEVGQHENFQGVIQPAERKTEQFKMTVTD